MKPPEETGPFDWTIAGPRPAAFSGPIQTRFFTDVRATLFLIRIDTGKWDPIHEDSGDQARSAALSDRKMVAFRRGYDLLTSTSPQRKRIPTADATLINGGWLNLQHPEELDLSTAFWWS